MSVCATCRGYGFARGGVCWNCNGSGAEPEAAMPTSSQVGMSEANAPKPLPLEAIERLKADVEPLSEGSLNATPVRAWGDSGDGPYARYLGDVGRDLRSLLSSYEAQGERLREVEGALSALAGSAERVRQMLDRDITRQGPDMRELGIPFVAAIHKAAALTQPPAVENGE